MMKKLILSIITLTALSFTSCSSDDDSAPTGGDANDVNAFVWRGLNTWYYWQSDIPDLSDNITETAYNSLITNNTPETLFNSLLYQKGVVDRNSFILSDYTVLENGLSGVSVSAGFEYGTQKFSNSEDSFIFIVYVVPGTSAYQAGIKRGDVFLSANGQNFTSDNTSTLLASPTVELVKGEFIIEDDGSTVIQAGDSITVQTSEEQENPIIYSSVIEKNGNKIGYLFFNSFTREFNDELNTVFADFKTKGINELVLDLRYNGGGDVEMATYLASMIKGEGNNGKLFSQLRFNEKSGFINNYNFVNTLNVYSLNQDDPIATESINELNLSRLFVIGTGNTASASELIINGLRPYMDVVLVGNTTYGKDVASFTLYDSSTFNKNNINPDHKYAMQPIVAKNFNSKGESDYSRGFQPDIQVDDFTEPLGAMSQFGELTEPMLNAALVEIDPSFVVTSSARVNKLMKKGITIREANLSSENNRLNYEMVIRDLPQ
ncbi:C-terminal processing peptidase [Flavobacteriaceae bacterium UJ101]|nr:C-terminal processing peptidase [Flavobacteriaceae bacterium UJ101]